MSKPKTEKEAWDNTTALLGDYRYSFGDHWSFNFRNDPKRLGFVLSRYKFSMKMIGKHKNILELGCSDGVGSTILGESAESYLGIDLDEPSLKAAVENNKNPNFRYLYDDFMGKTYGSFDAVVSLDVIEHILPEFEKDYFETILQNLSDDGICIIGTPNITSTPYASKASQLGHVNMYSQDRLTSELKKYFHQVFPFGMNDEILHTAFAPMAHYLLVVACHKREGDQQ